MAILPPARPDLTLSALHDNRIILGDCLDVLRGLPDASVDAIVTDPPYGLGAAPDMLDVLRAWLAGEPYQPRGRGGFMGKAWDAFVPGPEYWRECLRVLRPGGHALVFAGTRTWDVMGLALRLAGFELRDTLQWLYGSGFPKSLDVSKQIDRMAGAKRKRVGSYKGATNIGRGSSNIYVAATSHAAQTIVDITTPATHAARAWDGWGTALKPAWEPIIICRKPLAEPTVAANVLRWGTGALNIGASRVGTSDDLNGGQYSKGTRIQHQVYGDYYKTPGQYQQPSGRWPANLLLSHAADCQPTACSLWCPVRELDAQSGVCKSGAKGDYPARFTSATYGTSRTHATRTYEASEGGASRYFATFRYVAKASRSERNRGCEGLEARKELIGAAGHKINPMTGREVVDVPRANTHPCVKPQMLMSWLITLITPAGGVVLDPFAGSGSTLCAAKAGGWRYLGIEREAEYVAIAEARLAATAEPSLGSAVLMERPKAATATPRKRKANQPTQPLWEGQEMRA